MLACQLSCQLRRGGVAHVVWGCVDHHGSGVPAEGGHWGGPRGVDPSPQPTQLHPLRGTATATGSHKPQLCKSSSSSMDSQHIMIVSIPPFALNGILFGIGTDQTLVCVQCMQVHMSEHISTGAYWNEIMNPNQLAYMQLNQ